MKDYSNYHDTDYGAKIEYDGNLNFERSLEGYEGKNINIDGLDTKGVFITRYNAKFGELKYLLARRNEAFRGSIVQHELDTWMITSVPNDNGIYKKSEVQLCNSFFPIKTDEVSVLLTRPDGEPILNKFGDKQFKLVGGEIIKLPCIFENPMFNKDDNTQIALPYDSVKITIPYNDSKCIALNYEFGMYNDKYKISHVDYSKVINEIGVLTITAKVVNK